MNVHQAKTHRSRLLERVALGEEVIIAKAGKLSLPEPSGPYLIRKLGENRIEVLPIKLIHVLKN